MITEIERVTEPIVSNKYWGNPEFVLGNIKEHVIKNNKTNEMYGQFYWIRDIAYLSGGMLVLAV